MKAPERSTLGSASWRRLPAGIWALGFVSMLMDISSEMIHALLPVYLVIGLGTTAFTVGIIEGIAEATAAITKVFSGALSDRIGRRKELAAIGYGLAALTKPIFPLAPSVGWLIAARFIDRVGKGIRGAPRDALVADIAPPEIRGAAFGLRQSLDTVGAFLGPLLAMDLCSPGQTIFVRCSGWPSSRLFLPLHCCSSAYRSLNVRRTESVSIRYLAGLQQPLDHCMGRHLPVGAAYGHHPGPAGNYGSRYGAKRSAWHSLWLLQSRQRAGDAAGQRFGRATLGQLWCTRHFCRRRGFRHIGTAGDRPACRATTWGIAIRAMILFSASKSRGGCRRSSPESSQVSAFARCATSCGGASVRSILAFTRSGQSPTEEFRIKASD